MSKRNCKDCANMVAAIPIKKGKTVMENRLLYKGARTKCRKGMIMTNDGSRVRVFKNLSRPLQIWHESAQRCPCYDSMDD